MLGQLVAVGVVDLLAVPVPLGDLLLAVDLADAASVGRAGTDTRPRRIVPPLSVTLRCESSSEITGCSAVGLELAANPRLPRPQTLRANSMIATLQPETDAEERDPVLARPADRLDHACDPPPAEAARDQHAVVPRSGSSRVLDRSNSVAREPLDLDAARRSRSRRGSALPGSTCRRRAASVYLPTTAMRTDPWPACSDPVDDRPPRRQVGVRASRGRAARRPIASSPCAWKRSGHLVDRVGRRGLSMTRRSRRCRRARSCA